MSVNLLSNILSLYTFLVLCRALVWWLAIIQVGSQSNLHILHHIEPLLHLGAVIEAPQLLVKPFHSFIGPVDTSHKPVVIAIFQADLLREGQEVGRWWSRWDWGWTSGSHGRHWPPTSLREKWKILYRLKPQSWDIHSVRHTLDFSLVPPGKNKAVLEGFRMASTHRCQ